MMDDEELRHDAETGRRWKIAMEVWCEFLDGERENIIKEIEGGMLTDEELRVRTLELVVMKQYKMSAEYFISRGEIAEEELGHGG